MTMDICYLDRSGLNVSILNATETNLTNFTMAVATLLEQNADNCEDYASRALARAEEPDPDSDAGYSRWKTEQACQAARDATEANQAVTDWSTFWHEHTSVSVSSMLLAVNLVLTDLPSQQMGYGQHLITEGIKVLRDQGDLNLRII
jgi:hypothetical protein